MKKSCILMTLITSSLLIGPKLSAQVLYGDDKIVADCNILQQSTLIVVTLEENPDLVARLTKKNKTKELGIYQSAIKKYNEIITELAPEYLKVAKGDVQFKTLSNIVTMSAGERAKCSFMVYLPSTVFAGATPNAGYNAFAPETPINSRTSMGPGKGGVLVDFYSEKEKDIKYMVESFKQYMDFDCLYPDYEGPHGSSFTLIINNADKDPTSTTFGLKANPHNETILKHYFSSVIAQKGEMESALQSFKVLIDTAVAHGNKKYSNKQETQLYMHNSKNGVAMLKRRTLLINKDNLDASVTESDIKGVYPYSFKISGEDEIEKALNTRDSNVCVYFMYDEHGTNAYTSHVAVDPHTSCVVFDARNKDAYAKTSGKNEDGIYKVTKNAFKEMADLFVYFDKAK
jgi:hypothetical protein